MFGIYVIYGKGKVLSHIFVRVCDMSACCMLGHSKSPEAAVRRSQVYIPTHAGVVLFCYLE